MLCGYDAWKLAYPPWWDDKVVCEKCEQDEDECTCEEEDEEVEDDI